MRTPLAALVAVALPMVAAAADPPKFDVPKTWVKLDPQFPAVVAPRGEYQAWTTRVLVEETRMNRAQSFTETLFRQKRGDAEPQKLETVVTTHRLIHLLGPNGEVVSGFHSDARTLHLPGREPIPLRVAHGNWSRLRAREFAADGGLVCVAWVSDTKRSECAVLKFPIDRAKGTVGEPAELRPWQPEHPKTPDKYELDFSRGQAFARGRYVVTTGRAPNPEREGWPLTASEVWDTRTGKRVWLRAHASHGTVEAADDAFAYWWVGDLFRRPLDGSAGETVLALPKGAQRLAFDPPTVFAFVPRGEREQVLVGFDLATGARTDYDLVLPATARYRAGDLGDDGTRRVWLDGNFQSSATGPALWLSGDGVRAVADRVAYRVPAGKPVPAAVGWKPLPAGGK